MSGREELNWDIDEQRQRSPGMPEESEQEQGLALAVILQAFGDINYYIARLLRTRKAGVPVYRLKLSRDQAEDAYLFLLGLSDRIEPQWIRAYCRIAEIEWQTVLDAVVIATDGGRLFSNPELFSRANRPVQGRIRPSNGNHMASREYKKAADHE